MHSPVNDLTPHPLNSPLAWPDFVFTLQDALQERADDTAIYIVGGAVRDAYMRRPIKDIDLATSGSGLKLARWIANRFGGAFYPLDAERDVGRAIVTLDDSSLVLDVAALRGDLGADLTDRDFTINAMAVDLRGSLNAVIDPTGGAQDLREKRLRGCTSVSISTDPIRVLRAIRLSVQLGFRLDPATLTELRANVSRLYETSPERVRDEWFKILALPKPSMALRVAETVGALTTVLPELESSVTQKTTSRLYLIVERLLALWRAISPERTDEITSQFSLGMFVIALNRFRPVLMEHTAVEYADGRTHRALMVLAALAAYSGADAALKIAERFRLSNAEKDRLVAVVKGWSSLAGTTTDPLGIYHFWKAHGAAGIDVILLGLAVYLAERNFEQEQDPWVVEVERARLLILAYYEARAEQVDPPALINGDEIMSEFSLKPGRLIGELLEALREAQVTGEVKTRDDALEFAQNWLQKR